VRQGNRRGEHGIVAEDARGVALAGRVLDEAGVAGAEDVLGAVAQPDLENEICVVGNPLAQSGFLPRSKDSMCECPSGPV